MQRQEIEEVDETFLLQSFIAMQYTPQTHTKVCVPMMKAFLANNPASCFPNHGLPRPKCNYRAEYVAVCSALISERHEAGLLNADKCTRLQLLAPVGHDIDSLSAASAAVPEVVQSDGEGVVQLASAVNGSDLAGEDAVVLAIEEATGITQDRAQHSTTLNTEEQRRAQLRKEFEHPIYKTECCHSTMEQSQCKGNKCLPAFHEECKQRLEFKIPRNKRVHKPRQWGGIHVHALVWVSKCMNPGVGSIGPRQKIHVFKSAKDYVFLLSAKTPCLLQSCLSQPRG